MVIGSKPYIFNMATDGHLEFAIFRMFAPEIKKGTVSTLFLGVKLV